VKGMGQINQLSFFRIHLPHLVPIRYDYFISNSYQRERKQSCDFGYGFSIAMEMAMEVHI
jgi:hypothetical protein